MSKVKDLNTNLSIPIEYSSTERFTDDRFVKIKVLVMHDGVNLNGTNFSMDVIESAKNTLKDIPILAYIRKEDGESDFKGHESELVITKEGEIKERYLGRPVGVIPADNNYHYEIYDNKTYVAVDGYIWTDYANEALDILQRDGSKSQSMEIKIDDFSYNEDSDIFDVNSYRYRGITLLGDDVRPAMVGAKAELAQSFSYPDEYFSMVSELKDKLKEYAENQEEVNDMLEKDELEVNSEVQSEESEPITAEETTTEEFENVEETEEVAGEEIEPTEENSEEDADNSEIDDKEDNSDNTIESNEETTEEVVEENHSEEEVPSAESELQNAQATIAELNQAIMNLKNDISTMSAELEDLRTYKAEQEKEITYSKKQELVNSFAEGLTEDEMKPVVDKADELSYEEMEIQLNKIFSDKMLAELRSKKPSNKEGNEPPKMAFVNKDTSKSKYCV